MCAASTTAPDYPTDVAYPRTFFPHMAPAWLDFVALLSGFEPPARKEGFAWCELGCGQGVTAAILAATHPEGRFCGIDLMPDHIAGAQNLRERAATANLDLHCLDFAAAAERDLPRFDYIVAHGVYSWVDERSRADLRRFIAGHLASPGLVYISYNAMPGWAVDQPFQYLLHGFAEHARGDSVQRYVAAKAAVRRLADARALRNSPTAATELKRSKRQPAAAFFPHEYLVSGWRAFYVSEIRTEIAKIDLSPVGSATLMENFDSFVLRRAEREALAEIAEPDSRALVRDYFLLQRFRRDVLGRGLRRIGDRRRRQRLLACRFALTRPPSLVVYRMITPAGHVRFDNPVSRAIVAALADGPRRLDDLVPDSGTARDVLANAMALVANDVIRPVNDRPAPAGPINRALAELSTRSDPLSYVASPHGTALALDPAVRRHLRRGTALPERLAAWPEFLAGLC